VLAEFASVVDAVRCASDLFSLQDEITSRIGVAINLELVAAEAARPTEHPDALDYILQGTRRGVEPKIAWQICGGD
jgi:hypothetical protein